MKLKIETLINFNFHKVTGAAFKTNLAKSLDDLAKAAKAKVKKTFQLQKDIDVKKFKQFISRYVNIKLN